MSAFVRHFFNSNLQRQLCPGVKIGRVTGRLLPVRSGCQCSHNTNLQVVPYCRLLALEETLGSHVRVQTCESPRIRVRLGFPVLDLGLVRLFIHNYSPALCLSIESLVPNYIISGLEILNRNTLVNAITIIDRSPSC
jgi:hypothetical protein